MWILYFILYPKDAFDASCNGILLWFYQILPSLLPYAIISSVVISSNLLVFTPNTPGKKHRIPINSMELFVMFCGFLFGFPIGSKLAADLCEQGLITPKRTQLLCAFTNNMSPVFVSTFVLGECLKREELLAVTYLILYGIPLVYGIIGLMLTESQWNYGNIPKKPASRFQFNMKIIDAGITNSFETLIRLCGYIVMFSIMAHMLTQFPLRNTYLTIGLTGLLEITNGIAALSSSGIPWSVQYILTICFLTFGGISGIAQTGSMIQKAGLSLKYYIKTKLILTVLTTSAAGIYVILFLGSRI